MQNEISKRIADLNARVTKAWQLLKLDEKRARVATLEQEMNASGFWDDQNRAKAATSEHAGLLKEIGDWEQIKKDVEEAMEMARLFETEGDKASEADLEKRATVLEKMFDALEVQLLFKDPHDANGAIVSINAGAGGVDAQDWAEMLMRMVTRFAEKKDWQTEVVDISKGAEAGIKSATLFVRGRYAYGNLKSEHGVHRLVRISPFDAEAMRHTSFASIEVIPDLGEVGDVELNEKDLRIDVFRAGGHGGQGVNTTDSAVRIVHIPTGLTATVQNERSQQQNKAKALAILKSRVAVVAEKERAEEEAKTKGEYKSAEWGSQIRSYVLQPYKLVKDHRTKAEVTNPDAVLDGGIDPFIEAYLRWKA